jgi:hypothetical protein
MKLSTCTTSTWLASSCLAQTFSALPFEPLTPCQTMLGSDRLGDVSDVSPLAAGLLPIHPLTRGPRGWVSADSRLKESRMKTLNDHAICIWNLTLVLVHACSSMPSFSWELALSVTLVVFLNEDCVACKTTRR